MRETSRHNTVSRPKTTGSTRVYQTLRDEILRVQLAPGTPIDELSLSQRFDLSRSPIREALVHLSSEDLVIILPNRSTMVSPMEFDRMPEYLEALDLLQRIVTRLAARNWTSAAFKKIAAAQKAYEDEAAKTLTSGDSIPMIEKNFEFHMAIAAACGNGYFADSYRRLLQEGRRLLFFHYQYQSLDPNLTVAEIAADHTEMVKAIRDRDLNAAENVAHLHAEQFRGRFMEFLNRNLTATLTLHYGEATAP